MHDFQLGLFLPVVSRLTEIEIGSAPDEVIDVFTELRDAGVEMVEVSSEAVALSSEYLKRHILTGKYRSDALHIATATVEGVDILVSWNFRHVVHFDKIRMFNGTNLAMGYKAIDIRSPREVASDGDQRD